MSSHWEELFGQELVGKLGEKLNTKQHLEGKYVLIYFSAHWCGPCKAFTPKLASFYINQKALKDTHNDLEIVFVSSDRDEASFEQYFSEMPWVALPYSERSTAETLSSEFKVRGIPTLIVLDKEGSLITAEGRHSVLSEPARFPWRPRPITELFEGPLFDNSGKEVDAKTALTGKYFGIYFSAHWCGPCRQFTPQVIETYKKIKESGKEFEIVFVSCDRAEKQFGEYFATMPWLSTGFEDERNDSIQGFCHVNGIPQLTLVSENGTVISHNGRQAIASDPNGENFPWYSVPEEQKCIIS